MTDQICRKCGERVTEFGLCKDRPYVHANMSGLGWRLVPHRASDCIREQRAHDELAALILRCVGRHREREASDAR